ncbi:hypothetical protein SAMN05421595_2856 [Austwickia chelonae]|uniref:Uncharacterized protein n=1 Tax=Austwickia chelonae NBRC 105200 TaxID=1184607 RepID=K6W9S6_9MICO|nr:hypothetical protein [Austwickia chelonae]GAB78577.1 hypothetical protein AUCHE_12_00230 [Austwickia chelonae NBRC 105200]SEW40969.1 hypothetical protein SAMN05421595_2856 [Austwickia chelonae]
MGLGLLLLTAGAFLRFVIGRYEGMIGAYDVPGTVLMCIGVAAMTVAVAQYAIGVPHVEHPYETGSGPRVDE